MAVLISADALALLSDIDGLYTADPAWSENARLIPLVEDVECVMDLGQESQNEFARGGMITKLQARRPPGGGHRYGHCQRVESRRAYELFDGKPWGRFFGGKAMTNLELMGEKAAAASRTMRTATGGARMRAHGYRCALRAHTAQILAATPRTL